MAVVITAAMAEEVITAAMAEEVITAAMVVAMVVVLIQSLMLLIPINPLAQKVGKTEAMEILLKTLNMKAVGAGEKGESPIEVLLQTRQIRNPFLQAPWLI